MKSLFGEPGGTYPLGKDRMYYPNLTIEEADHRSIGKWGRMNNIRSRAEEIVRAEVITTL